MEKSHPQTRAETIGKNGCLAYCYMYCVGIEPDNIEYFKILSHALDEGFEVSGIKPDCSVDNAERFLNWLTGRHYKVDKRVCVSIDKITEPTPVNYIRYDVNSMKHNHFVVVADGQIVFNPLEFSASVQDGRPESARYITLG